MSRTLENLRSSIEIELDDGLEDPLEAGLKIVLFGSELIRRYLETEPQMRTLYFGLAGAKTSTIDWSQENAGLGAVLGEIFEISALIGLLEVLESSTNKEEPQCLQAN